MNNIALVYSEKCNQFYEPIRIDNDVGICYMKPTKNRHEKVSKQQIIRVEDNDDMKFIVMHNSKITAEQYFIETMDNDAPFECKMSELRKFKKNMLIHSEKAMEKLIGIAKTECDRKDRNYSQLMGLHNAALELYSSMYHRQIINDLRSTYIGQDIPNDIQQLALKKRLFVQRSDDFSGDKTHRHPCTRTERLQIQSIYPCGFIIRNRCGIVIAGKKFTLSAQEAIEFVKNYISDGREYHYYHIYQVPMSPRKKRQLGTCYNILKEHGLHYKNEHNYFFWVLDKQGNVIAGGKNGFGFKWLHKYCRKLKQNAIKKEK